MPRKNKAEVVKEPKTKARKTGKPAILGALTDSFIPENLGVEMPDPHEFLSAIQRDGEAFGASKIYRETWEWLNKKGCADAVSPQLLERYAVSTARWMQCEAQISNLGFLSKHPTTGKPVSSPFVDMGIAYMNQSMKMWDEISQIVIWRESAAPENGDDDAQIDVLGRLL